MDRHPIPRQVTTFQFKLIGFLTVKQFAYLLATTAFTIMIYFLIPVPIINIVMAGMVGAAGAAFSLLTYNDRSFDIWIKNLALAIVSPSQYRYMKSNHGPAFLEQIFMTPPATINAHIDANQKLSAYIGPPQNDVVESERQNVSALFLQNEPTPIASGAEVAQQPTTSSAFLTGTIKNSKGVPLENIMVYLKSENGSVVRILKTNHHGVFASFHSLPDGSYSLEPKDLSSRSFFDTMNVIVHGLVREPLNIASKDQ